MTIEELYNQLLPFAGQPLAIPGSVFPATDTIARFCVGLLNGNGLVINVNAGGVILSADKQTLTLKGKTPSYSFGNFDITLTVTLVLGHYSADIAIDFSSQHFSLPGIDWFALANPGLAFSVGNATVPVSGAISGDVVVNGKTVRLSMALPIAKDFWAFQVVFKPDLTIDEVSQLIGGVSIAGALQAPFSTIATSLGVKEIGFVCRLNPAKRLSTQILIETPDGWTGWTFAPGVTITAADLALSIDEAKAVGYDISSSLTVAGIEIALSAQRPGPNQGWTFQGQTQDGQHIELTALFKAVCSLWAVTLPQDFPVIYFMNLYFSFNTQLGAFTFGGVLDASRSGQFPMAGKAFAILFTVQVDYAKGTPSGTYSGSLTGTLSVGEAQFGVEYDFGNNASTLIGYWRETGAETLNLADIAKTFGNSDLVDLLQQIPPNMDLGLTSASLTYDFTGHTLVLTAVSKNYGHLVFVAAKPADSWVFAFLVAIGEINLTQLPLIGEEVGKFGKFEIDDLNLLVCSGKIASDEIKNINQLIQTAAQKTGATLPTLPEAAAGLQRGVNLSLTFQVVGYTAPVAVGTATPKSGGSQTLLLAAERAAEQVTSALVLADTPSGGNNLQTQNGYWINLQKAFGPVYMDKIGFAYVAGALEISFNFSLKLGALTITLDGLMVGSLLTKFDPIFGLQGLSITFKSSAVEISGGFIKQEIDGVTQYNGQALIKAGTFALAALGSYARVNGETSLFVFALISEPPLGGPPYFFVTGVAAGFGYNRSLVIPTIDQVSTFPLVSGFVPGQSSPFSDNDPGKALQVLVSQNIVPIQIGQDWLAAGVQFTSFEMLQSFALVVVEFGTSLEIALLGLTTASIPTGDPRPLLFAQLALEVRIKPDEGVLAVDAKLTSNSYLLDSACHLTGGFAFYIWFGKNPHAGDFVVTLGGYHPNFNKPDHYPDVPQLGFNWVVNSQLTIKGGMYFALTPICLMAGGSLQALWQSGDLKAWFDLGADFLIAWKPYHYEIDVYINFGVSYTFRIDLLFTSITVTISVSLGADLSIWGPAFSGVAHIHLWIISFTIHFGAGASQTPPPIPWSEFEQSFLPPATNPSQQQARLARRSQALATDAVLADEPVTQYQAWTVSVLGGPAKTVAPGPDNPDDMDWIVNPEGTGFEVKTLVPAKKYILVVQGMNLATHKPVPVEASQIVITNQTDLKGINVAFGVGPSAVATDDFESAITITLTYEDGLISSKQKFYFTAIIQTAPKALWLPGPADITNNKTLVSNVLLGFDFKSGALQPDETPWADVSLLAFKDYPYAPALTWAAPTVVDGPAQPADPFAQLKQTIVSAPSRAGILSSLVAGGTPIDSKVDVQYIAAKASDFLLAPPIFVYEYEPLPS
jgi:hypothetical protein